MIPRYTPDDIGAVWTDAHRIHLWLEVELAALEVLCSLGQVPAEDLALLRAAADKADKVALAARALEIEKTTKHDVIAFLTAFEELAGAPARHVHFGMTSSDVLDTAFALQLVEAARLIEGALGELLQALARRVQEHRRTAMIGRSHGIHAEPVSFGFVLAGYYAELRRSLERMRAARAAVAVGKISGAVGTSAHLPLEVEERALAKLGLSPEPAATQVVARDRHATFFVTLAQVAASLERLATEIRHLQRTEVREVEEPFSRGQKGSSAMPHKRNPILTENVTGLARLVRGHAVSALENVALWHERDISHSSVERVIAPDATIALVFMCRRMRSVVEGLVVYPERMGENLAMMRGLVFSQSVLLALTQKGLARQAAYAIVQRASMRVWDEGLEMKRALLEDPELRGHMGEAEISACFDLERHLDAAERIITRALRD